MSIFQTFFCNHGMHRWDEWQSVRVGRAAVCALDRRSCKRCGALEQRNEQAHSWGEWRNVLGHRSDACQLEVRACTHCAAQEERNQQAHQWGEWKCRGNDAEELVCECRRCHMIKTSEIWPVLPDLRRHLLTPSETPLGKPAVNYDTLQIFLKAIEKGSRSIRQDVCESLLAEAVNDSNGQLFRAIPPDRLAYVIRHVRFDIIIKVVSQLTKVLNIETMKEPFKAAATEKFPHIGYAEFDVHSAAANQLVEIEEVRELIISATAQLVRVHVECLQGRWCDPGGSELEPECFAGDVVQSFRRLSHLLRNGIVEYLRKIPRYAKLAERMTTSESLSP